MSQITKIIISCFLLVGGLMLMSGCGSSTSNSNASTSGGQHPSGWLPAGHKTAAQQNEESCAECHGSAFTGGIAGVSCTQCHLGGKDDVHPANWDQPVTHKNYVGLNSSTACANVNCHGADLSGVADSGPSCTSCHIGGAGSVHPLRWLANPGLYHRWYALNAMSTNPTATISCATALCHGANLQGVAQSGPACGDCHAKTRAIATCNSCHSFPPSSNKHSNHIVLQDVDCSVCHTNNHAFATGTAHTGPVHMQFPSLFSAKSSTSGASYDTTANTCSKVSCHGGQTTPSWQSGTFDVNTKCTSCHAFGTAEYNSFSSGEHDVHVNQENVACITCHDTVKLATNHFTSLLTTTMEGPASATLNNALNYNGVSCTPTCHSTRNWK